MSAGIFVLNAMIVKLCVAILQIIMKDNLTRTVLFEKTTVRTIDLTPYLFGSITFKKGSSIETDTVEFKISMNNNYLSMVENLTWQTDNKFTYKLIPEKDLWFSVHNRLFKHIKVVAQETSFNYEELFYVAKCYGY